MHNRSSKNQTEHDYMVTLIAEKLKRNGWKVKADVAGYERPSQMGSHRPDIYASKNVGMMYDDKVIIIEVETCDTVVDEHCQAQISDFCQNKRAEVCIALPKTCCDFRTTDKLYKNLSHRIKVIWVDTITNRLSGTASICEE